MLESVANKSFTIDRVDPVSGSIPFELELKIISLGECSLKVNYLFM